MDVSLLVFGVAHHWNSPTPQDNVTEYRDFNPGLGAKIGYSNINMLAGRYLNSIDNWSNFAGPGVECSHIQFNLVYIDGYDKPGRLAPIIGAYYGPLHLVYLGDSVGLYAEFKLNPWR